MYLISQLIMLSSEHIYIYVSCCFLDVLQLLMLSAGTLMSLEIIMFLLNTFYCKLDTVCMLSIYLIVCVCNFILFFFRSIILSCDTTSWNWSFYK
jgi:hypothetical protein